MTELTPEIIAAHDAALADGSAGYADPATGLFVLTSRFLAERGWCCGNGCRHCPYSGDAKQIRLDGRNPTQP